MLRVYFIADFTIVRDIVAAILTVIVLLDEPLKTLWIRLSLALFRGSIPRNAAPFKQSDRY